MDRLIHPPFFLSSHSVQGRAVWLACLWRRTAAMWALGVYLYAMRCLHPFYNYHRYVGWYTDAQLAEWVGCFSLNQSLSVTLKFLLSLAAVVIVIHLLLFINAYYGPLQFSTLLFWSCTWSLHFCKRKSNQKLNRWSVLLCNYNKHS